MTKRNLEPFVPRQFLTRAGGLMLTSLVKSWMGTLEFQSAYYDTSIDPVMAVIDHQRIIFVFWHEFIPYQLYLRGHCDVTMLTSQNRDAELLSHAAGFMGFGVIRGSTFEGGSTALRNLIRTSKLQHLAITPDGPRGPRRQLAQGPIYLASRLQMPLVVLGLGYDRPWRLSSWDRFAIPRPFSRARCIWGPPMRLPRRLDRDGVEHYRQRAERLLNRLTLEAEAWAESGTRKLGQLPTRRQSKRRERSGRDILKLPQEHRLPRSAEVTRDAA